MPIPDATIERFVKGVLDGTGKRGLWCFGPRKSGTSTAVKQLVKANRDVFPEYNCKRKAEAVEAQIKQLWKLDGLLRANGTDFALWRDAANIEEELEYLWAAEALWIDDLYPELEPTFVRKNILLKLDAAMKMKHIVLVSGNCRPEFYNTEWGRAISTDYEVVEFSLSDD